MSTQQLSDIKQALIDNPHDKHAVIASQFGIASRTVTMVCREMDIECKHGTKRKVAAKYEKRSKSMKLVAARKKAQLEADIAAGLVARPYPRRSCSINIYDEDWDAFRRLCESQGTSRAAKLGNMVRQALAEEVES